MAYTDRSPIIMQGKVLIAERQFNGPLTSGYEWIGNSDNFVLSFKPKRERIVGSFSEGGLTIAAPVVETEIEVMFNMMDLSVKNLARASWGTVTAGEIAGTAATYAATAYNDGYIQLPRTQVSNVSISGLTVDVDYVVDRNGSGGLIHILPTSSVVAEGSPVDVTVTYDYAANNGTVEAFTTSQKFYSLIMNGFNVAQASQPHILTVHQFQMDPWKKADFIDKKQMRLETGGEILLDSSIPDTGELSQVFSIVKG